jgi:hypothetical protein
VVATVNAYGVAGIAAGAAILGGILTAGSNLLMEGQRRRDQRSAQRERDQRELRKVTRLVLSELHEISQTVRGSARSHLTWPTARELTTHAWLDYREILAANLPPDGWRWVEAAYTNA